MANKITEEMKIQINELYLQLGVKSQVAKKLGISASSVSRYIIEDYVPAAKKNVRAFKGVIMDSQNAFDELVKNFKQDSFLTLSANEKSELVLLQKEEV